MQPKSLRRKTSFSFFVLLRTQVENSAERKPQSKGIYFIFFITSNTGQAVCDDLEAESNSPCSLTVMSAPTWSTAPLPSYQKKRPGALSINPAPSSAERQLLTDCEVFANMVHNTPALFPQEAHRCSEQSPCAVCGACQTSIVCAHGRIYV